MIANAPGKVVVWGEYAVLEGAPAAVMAVDRRAQCEISTQQELSSFSSAGFLSTAVHTPHKRIPDAPVASLMQAVVNQLGTVEITDHLRCHFDTRAFFQDGEKLGLGSSAALCCAIYACLCALLGRTPLWQDALEAHQKWQGGGSGLDIACSWHGGVVRFQQAGCTSFVWPEDWHFALCNTGQAASTQAHVNRFSAWRGVEKDKRVNALGLASETLFGSEASLDVLGAYIDALRALDQSGALNIFSPQHETLATIASDTGVLYKPCGAGGGDIGIAITDSAPKLNDFCMRAAQVGFGPLDMEIAVDGIRTRA